jgi:uncharacterized repeat protein (TIGR01451 family)
MENKMKHDSIEQQGRALLRESAKQIRRSETSKLRRISAGSMAMAVAAMQIVPAFATIDNTVTVSGFGPGGVPVGGSATENVDVVNDAAAVTVIKSAAFAIPADDVDGDGKADAGDKITYTYTVTNSGNVTVRDVTVTDAHDGAGTAPVIVVPVSVTTDVGTVPLGTVNDSVDPVTGDGDWDKLGPGDVITFTSTYTVVTADITSAGGGSGTGFSTNPEPDGFLDNTATASATYNDGVTTITVSDTDTRNFILDVTTQLSITKIADDVTDVIAGQVITYTYTVTNNGNTPLTNITLADTHNGIPGSLTPAFGSFTTNTGSTNTGNTITLLQPGDVAVYTATYTVTQADIDNRQ